MDKMKVKKTVRRLTEARAALVRDNPFFGRLSMGLQLACAPCETACTDGNRLIFDPEFTEKLSDRELQFVTLHEVMHPELPKAILIFTDGYAPWPDERAAQDVAVLWLISKDGKDDAPWGKVVRL